MKIAQYLVNTIEAMDMESFEKTALQDNIRRGRILAYASIAFEIIYACINILALIFQVDNRFKYYVYLLMYVLMTLINVFFLLYFHKQSLIGMDAKQVKHKQKVILLYITAVMSWGSIVSLLDQELYGQLMVFIINMITCSVVFLIDPKKILIPYVLSVCILAAGLPFFQPSGDILIGHYVNLVFFIFVSYLASRIIYHFYCRDFNHRVMMEKSRAQLENQIEENKRINAMLSSVNHLLEEMSLVDDLTGIPNRRCFRNYIDAGLSNPNKKTHLSIIMADIDFFKGYNDNYGHGAGDDVLFTVAQQINQSVRDLKDFAARWGGEEFIFASFDNEPEDIYLLAQDIRQKILSLKILHEYSKASPFISLSLGISSMVIKNKTDISKVIEQADFALYKAKTNGRNCVKIYEADSKNA